jgi:hypothetical protein
LKKLSRGEFRIQPRISHDFYRACEDFAGILPAILRKNRSSRETGFLIVFRKPPAVPVRLEKAMPCRV